MRIAGKRCITVAFPGDKSVFFVENHQRDPKPYAFPRWNTVEVEVVFSPLILG